MLNVAIVIELKVPLLFSRYRICGLLF